jgi:major vault protein
MSNPTTNASTAKGSPVYRIPPHHYIHVLDQNTNVTRLEIGPKTFIKQDNESVIIGPEKMITVPYVTRFVFARVEKTDVNC